MEVLSSARALEADSGQLPAENEHSAQQEPKAETSEEEQAEKREKGEEEKLTEKKTGGKGSSTLAPVLQLKGADLAD